jgi:hypothetical protein
LPKLLVSGFVFNIEVVDIKTTKVGLDFMDAVVAPVPFFVPNVMVMRADKTSVVALGIEFILGKIINARNKTKSCCFSCLSFGTVEVSHEGQ